jgi:hypothetical protein
MLNVVVTSIAQLSVVAQDQMMNPSRVFSDFQLETENRERLGTRRDRVNYIPTLNVGLKNWKPTFNFSTFKPNLDFSNLDEDEKEKEPAMVEEPATKEIEIQCDLSQEFVEEKVVTFECQFIGISEKGTQLATSRPTNIKATSNLVPVTLDKFLKFNKRKNGPTSFMDGP